LQGWPNTRERCHVQNDTLIEHVWAEIEHDVVYKSGANWSTHIKRRFASIAGVLELLEHEIDQLEEAATALIEERRATPAW
jgi:ppGpp synthetase/RelA/SpoT-type nucleotidyltranferase